MKDSKIKISVPWFLLGIVMLCVGIFFFALGLMYCGRRIETGDALTRGLFSLLSWALAAGALIGSGLMFRDSIALTKKKYFCSRLSTNSPVYRIDGHDARGLFVITETWSFGNKDHFKARECFTGLPIEKNDGCFYFKDYPLVMFDGICIEKDGFADLVMPLYSHRDECVQIVLKYLKEEEERLEAKKREEQLKQKKEEEAKKAKEEWVDEHF